MANECHRLTKNKSTRVAAADRKLRNCVLLAMLAAGTVNAGMDDVEQAIADCATHGLKDSRIACLEDKLRRTAAGSGTPSDAATEADPGMLPDPQAASGAPAQEEADTEEPPLPSSGAPAEGDSAIRAADARPEPPRSGMDELGAEQVARRSETGAGAEAPVGATVVAVDVVGYRRLLVELDNGQVWRQTNGDRADVVRDLRNKQTFDVELRRTGLGGYRMYIAPLDRTIRVERLK